MAVSNFRGCLVWMLWLQSLSQYKKIDDYIKKVGSQINVQKVILFGSYAKQQFHGESDIDLAIFSDDFIGMEPIDRFRLLFLIAADYGVDLQLLAFTPFDLSEPEGLLEETISTGLKIAITN